MTNRDKWALLAFAVVAWLAVLVLVMTAADCSAATPC